MRQRPPSTPPRPASMYTKSGPCDGVLSGVKDAIAASVHDEPNAQSSSSHALIAAGGTFEGASVSNLRKLLNSTVLTSCFFRFRQSDESVQGRDHKKGLRWLQSSKSSLWWRESVYALPECAHPVHLQAHAPDPRSSETARRDEVSHRAKPTDGDRPTLLTGQPR